MPSRATKSAPGAAGAPEIEKFPWNHFCALASRTCPSGVNFTVSTFITLRASRGWPRVAVPLFTPLVPSRR